MESLREEMKNLIRITSTVQKPPYFDFYLFKGVYQGILHIPVKVEEVELPERLIRQIEESKFETAPKKRIKEIEKKLRNIEEAQFDYTVPVFKGSKIAFYIGWAGIKDLKKHPTAIEILYGDDVVAIYKTRPNVN